MRLAIFALCAAVGLAQTPLPSPFAGGGGGGGGSPITGATVNCLVDAATATTLETKTNCPTVSSAGAITLNGSGTGAIDMATGSAPSAPASGFATLFFDANSNLTSETSGGVSANLQTGWILSDKGGAAADEIFIGNVAVGDSLPGIWMGAAASAPSFSNWAILAQSTKTRVNAASTASLEVGGAPGINVNTGPLGPQAVIVNELVTPNIVTFGGTTFTISGCSADTPVGTPGAGSFLSHTTGACTVVITINGATGLAAPNGWACAANNLTTANLMRMSANSTTTCTVTGTTVTGDKISFIAIGY